MNAGTYQVKCLTVWFNFMLFHIFDKAAVGVSREEQKIKFLIRKAVMLQSFLSTQETYY